MRPLKSVTSAGATPVTYDDHNRVSTLSGKTFGWNARNEHVSTMAGAVTVGIERDGFGRVFRRSQTGQADVWYGYGTGDDKASYTGTVTAGALTLTDQMQSLPGGVTVSRKATGGVTRYTLPNVHGDMAAVVDQSGVKQGATYRWDPDGMPTGGTTQPDLLSGGFENGWLGQHFRPVDTTDPAIPVIEMGARPYLPSIGRFLSVDPVEGGNDNDYNYPTDPVNGYDLTGEVCYSCAWNKSGGKLVSGAKSVGTAAVNGSRDAGVWVYQHTELTVTPICLGFCGSIGFQGGTLYKQLGFGCCSAGVSVAVARKKYEDRNCGSRGVSIPVRGGAGVMGEFGVKDNGDWDFGDWAFGVSAVQASAFPRSGTTTG